MRRYGTFSLRDRDFGCGAAKTEVENIQYMFIVCRFEESTSSVIQPLVAGQRAPNAPPTYRPYT